MMASLPHAVERTLTIFDQLGAMWGPDVRLSLSVHGLTHGQVHELFRQGGVEDGPAADWTTHPYVRAELTTSLGWSVGFFAHADLTCDRCRELVGLPCDVVGAVEAAQLAGMTDRMDGAGL